MIAIKITILVLATAMIVPLSAAPAAAGGIATQITIDPATGAGTEVGPGDQG